MSFKRIDKGPDAFNRFITGHRYGSYYQTTYYAEAEKLHGFRDYAAVSVGSGDEIEAGALIKLKAIPHTPFYYAYLRMGFVLDYDRNDWRELLDALWLEVIREMRSRHVIYFRYDLPVEDHRGDVYERFKAYGSRQTGLFDDNSYYTYFRFRAILDITPDEKELMKGFSSTNRQCVKKCEKYGLELRYGGLEDIGIYQQLKDETGERNHISSQSLKEAELIFSELEKSGTARLYLVRLVPAETLKILRADLAGREKELSKLQAKARPNPTAVSDIEASIEKLRAQIGDMEALEKEKPEGLYLSAGITFGHGETLDYLYAGSSSEYRDYLPNYRMVWQLIKDAKADGYKYVDMGGTDPEDKPSPLSIFKKKWGCRTAAFSGDMDYVVSRPLGNIFRYLMDKKVKNQHA